MSLFYNPKTSNYSELNVRLIILEKLIIDNLANNGVDSSGDYLPKDLYEEDIATYFPSVPKFLNTYSSNSLFVNIQNFLLNYFLEENGSDPFV
jgi:hypothetical protein